MLAYKVKKNSANALMNEARRNQGDNRAVYPPMDDNSNLPNQLGTFFFQKIETIGSNLDNMAQGLPALPNDYAPVSPPPLANLSPLRKRS